MLKNVTITLPEETLRAVRIAAAHDGVSMSKWLGRLVEVHIQGNPEAIEAERRKRQGEALARFLALPKASLPLTDENGMAPSKEWMNERESLRRFQHSDLFDGPEGERENQALRHVAEPPSPDWPDRPVASGDQ